jgi:hypothetical protein
MKVSINMGLGSAALVLTLNSAAMAADNSSEKRPTMSQLQLSKDHTTLLLQKGKHKTIPGPKTYRLNTQQGTFAAVLKIDSKGIVELLSEPDSKSLDKLSLADVEDIWGPRENPESVGNVVSYVLISPSTSNTFVLDLGLKNNSFNKQSFSRDIKIEKFRIRSVLGWTSWINTRQGE